MSRGIGFGGVNVATFRFPAEMYTVRLKSIKLSHDPCRSGVGKTFQTRTAAMVLQTTTVTTTVTCISSTVGFIKTTRVATAAATFTPPSWPRSHLVPPSVLFQPLDLS